MKKITLLLAFALMSIATQAQEIIDRPVGASSTGLISTKGNDGTAVYLADHFVIDEEVTLGNLDFMGFGSIDIETGGMISFADNVTGFNVYVYEDDNGTPAGDPVSGGEVFKLENITDANYTLVTESDDGTVSGDFVEIDLTAANGGTEIVLEAGSYWISAAPSVSTAPTGNGRWNWLESDAPTDYESKLIDPTNLFGAGATSWLDISLLLEPGETWNALAWTLRDETALAVAGNFDLSEMVSVYPNPTSDFVQLKLPSNIEVNSVQLFDLLGKKIDVTLNNNQIDLSSFAEGVYMINIETNQGKLTKKIIKK